MTEFRRNLRHQFLLFSRLHKTISLHQINKWFNQAEVFDKKNTAADTETVFNKFNRARIEYEDFENFLKDFAEQNKIYIVELERKLLTCGVPNPNKKITF